MELELHPEAIVEARQARLHYSERSVDAGAAFFLALESAIQLIWEAPHRWPAEDGVRRYVMRRFPYLVFYRVLEFKVEIIAIAHGRRRPGYWKPRK